MNVNDFQGHSPASREAFRLLRAQLRELTDLCSALTSAGNIQSLWRRIVRNAQLMLAVDGCTYYRREDNHLVCAFLMSKALGLTTEEEHTVPDIIAAIPLFDSQGQPCLQTAAARTLHSARFEHTPNVTHLKNYSASRTRTFDERMGYRTVSMLSVPVQFRQQPVMGVLQLINPHNADGEVVDFDDGRLEVAMALASTIALAQTLAERGNTDRAAASKA